MKSFFSSEVRRRLKQLAPRLIYGVIAALLGAAAMYGAQDYLASRRQPARGEDGAHGTASGDEGSGGEESEAGPSDIVRLPRTKWRVAGIRVEPVQPGTLRRQLWVTGKLTLNEDRLAHIYSLVEGTIHRVNVRFGQDVEAGEVLAIVDSKEVGEAKLTLYGNRLKAEFAKVNHEWKQQINQNTQMLIATLRKEPPITDLERLFLDKPMGEYREMLISAYARLHKSQADYERLKPLADRGVTAGKQLLAAKAVFEADRATFLALLEQLKFSAWQDALRTEQAFRQAERAVAVSRSQLYILGYRTQDLTQIDPVAEGETISHYEIRAPFNGTVIGKNVVLAERVGPDTELFQVADLSTVWVQADIYQKDLDRLKRLGSTIRFRAPPSKLEHEAEIFYRGDVLDPDTRTIRLRAMTANPKRDLKPGMFIEVALPGEVLTDVLRLPSSAVQEVDGQTIVFVQREDGTFERRDVTVGATSNGEVQIVDGLREGEPVVVEGGFALKSEMLKYLMSDDD